MKMEQIAVMTSGGDAPGMNACLRAVVRTAIYKKLKVIGVKRGYEGLVNQEFVRMELRSVSGIINRGGTILKTVRSNQIKTPDGLEKACKSIVENRIDGLIVIGGDGSFKGAMHLYEKCRIPMVGIPATIDNDVAGTDYTIGFDTAVNTALQAIDKIRDTATSHERVFIVEVMGRSRGFIALEVGVASGAEFILIPEIKYDLNKICESLSTAYKRGKSSCIIVMAEGAGNAFAIADQIEKETGLEARVSVIGYIQRGGSPSYRSRMIASLFGKHAVEVILGMKQGDPPEVVGIRAEKVISYKMEYVLKNEKKINRELYELAQILAT